MTIADIDSLRYQNVALDGGSGGGSYFFDRDSSGGGGGYSGGFDSGGFDFGGGYSGGFDFGSPEVADRVAEIISGNIGAQGGDRQGAELQGPPTALESAMSILSEGRQLNPAHIKALDASGFGNVTGFNLANPTQSVSEMAAAQKFASYLPRVIGLIAPPISTAMSLYDMAQGLISGKTSFAGTLLNTGLALAAKEIGISLPVAKDVLAGNFGSAAEKYLLGQITSGLSRETGIPSSLLGIALKESGIGSSISEGISSGINTFSSGIGDTFDASRDVGGYGAGETFGYGSTGESGESGGASAAAGRSETEPSGFGIRSLLAMGAMLDQQQQQKQQEDEVRRLMESAQAVPSYGPKETLMYGLEV